MKKTLSICKYTFIEVYRSKIMLGLFFIAIAVLLITYIASEFTYGAPDKVALDFGVGVLSLSNLAVAIFLGATLLSKEIETKTLYMILSRPISRSSFLIGKILGLTSVLLINTVFVGAVSSLVFSLLGGNLSSLIVWTCLYVFVEAFVIMLFAVLLSLITNVTLSVLYTVIILVIGHSVNDTINLFFAKSNPFFSSMLKVATFIIPDFERLNLKDYLIYKQSLSFDFLLINLGYISFYIAAVLILISYIFNRKNLD